MTEVNGRRKHLITRRMPEPEPEPKRKHLIRRHPQPPPVGPVEEPTPPPLTAVYLAAVYFPRACWRNYRHPGHNWKALAHHIAQWKQRGVPLEFAQAMIDMFAEHPRAWSRSRVPAWVAFVLNQDAIAYAVEDHMAESTAEGIANEG